MAVSWGYSTSPALAWLASLILLALTARVISRSLRPKVPVNDLRGPPSSSWVAGNLKEIHDPRDDSWRREIVKKYGKFVKVHGMLNSEMYYMTDVRALNHMVFKEQHNFVRAQWRIALSELLFGDGLTSADGLQHIRQRKIMNPVFSTAHTRTLAPIFQELTDQLCTILEEKVLSSESEIDILDWMSRLALECLGQAGLGYSFKSLDEGYMDELHDAMNRLVPTLGTVAPWMPFFPNCKEVFGKPSWQKALVGLVAVLHNGFRKLCDVVRTMDKHSREIVRVKKQEIDAGDPTVLKREPGMGKDAMSVLMRANMAASAEDRLSDEELLGQVCLLIFAGQDTTSSALCRVIHHLTLQPAVQEALRQEVRAARARHGGQHIPYDDLMALPFLDAIVRETLRLHPPAPFLERVAKEATILPLLQPIEGADGRMMSEVPIAKNQTIFIDIAQAHRDPAIWGPDADQWNPRRWLKEGEEPNFEAGGPHRLPGVWSGILTFGTGETACIGYKFSLLEMKIVLSSLVHKFQFEMPMDKEIRWMLWSIRKPIVGGDESNPRFPVKLSLLS